jgi:hypothetical protein
VFCSSFSTWPQIIRVQEFLAKHFDSYQTPTVRDVEVQIIGQGDRIALRKNVWKRFQELKDALNVAVQL